MCERIAFRWHQFGFFTSLLLIVMLALGGWGTSWGPMLGALVYTAVPALLRHFHHSDLFLFGLCMILVLLYFENGLIGLLTRRR